ncbi:MAG: transglutaminase-like domain-containing protein [Bacteroidetes bacterium]|nr:transglutaminase-like domain-containing protein [Bacteroidota bacterium]
MKRILLALLAGFLVFALIPGCSVTKVSKLKTFPKKTKAPYNVNLDSLEKKYPGEKMVYTKNKTTYEYADGKYILKEGSYVLLDADDQTSSTFGLTLSSDRVLKDVSLRTINPDGTTQVYGRENLSLEKDSEKGMVYKFAYPGVVKGTIIEENYEIQNRTEGYSASTDIFIPFQTATYAESLITVVVFPTPQELKFKRAGTDPSKYTVTKNKEKKKTIINFEKKDMPPNREESYSPYFKETGEFVQFQIKDYAHQGIKNWEDISFEFDRFAASATSLFGLRVSSTTKKLIESKTTEYEKAKAISDWIRDTIVPENNYYMKDFDDVISTKKGNVFVITGLLLEMLRKADIKAEFILIHDQDEGPVDMNYYSYREFSTPAVVIHLAGGDLVSIPYVKALPFGFLPDHFQGQKAMVVKKVNDETKLKAQGQGYVKKDVKFIDTPVSANLQNTATETYNIEIDTDGKMKVKEIKELTGTMAFGVRTLLTKVSEGDLKDKIKEFLTYTQGEVKLTNQKIDFIDQPDSILRITLEYTIDNLITVTPEEVIFQTGGLLSPASIKKYLVDEERRVNQIRIKFDENYIKHITIKTPENWVLVSDLKKSPYKNQFGSFTTENKINKGELVIHQERKLVRSSGIKAEYPELVNLTGSKSSFSVPNIIFKVE